MDYLFIIYLHYFISFNRSCIFKSQEIKLNINLKRYVAPTVDV